MRVPDSFRVHIRDHGEGQDAAVEVPPTFLQFVLDGSRITSKQLFGEALARDLPCDPPLTNQTNWDAMIDSVYGGLVSACGECIIRWVAADTLLRHAPEDFGIAVSVLAAIAENASADHGLGAVCRVTVLVDL
jgi:hypothetical protein